MSENALTSAHQELYKTHLQQLQRKAEIETKRESAAARAWELQMRCYTNGNQECIHEYDQLFIESQHLNRESVAEGKKCIKACESSVPGYNFGTQVADNETLKSSRQFFSCIKPCVERSIEYTNSEIKVAEKTIRVVNGYLKQ